MEFLQHLFGGRAPRVDNPLQRLQMTGLVMAGVLAATYLRARGERKQRVRWVFWSTLVGFTGVIVWTIWPSLQIAVLTSIAIPIGYAYAILRHRVIDVSFVVNRAIVFTVVTTFGRISLKIRNQFEAPRAIAASTKSFSRRESTWPRIGRAT